MMYQNFNFNSNFYPVSTQNCYESSLSNSNMYTNYYQQNLNTTSPISNYAFNYSFGSSGYSSIENSFNTNSPISSINTSINQTETNKGKKRKLDETSHVDLSNTELIMQQIFKPPTPKAKKPKRETKLKKKLAEIEIQAPKSNDEFFLEDDEDDFLFNELQMEANTSSNNELTKKKRVLTRTQRLEANERERKRMRILNESFMNLRHVLPQTTGRKRRKMSRFDIVLGAIEYISYLDEILKSNSAAEIDFNTKILKSTLDFLDI